MPRFVVTVPGAVAVLCLLSAAPAAGAPFDLNPCLGPSARELRCPDLRMRAPFGLYVDRTSRGRVRLRAGNSIDNVGLGPAELHGVRTSRSFMRGRQRIYKRGGGRRGFRTGARLIFKYVSGQRSYWKFHHAARFELWSLDRRGRRKRRVRRGPKLSYCLRDLRHTHPRLRRSPARFVYPACHTSSRLRRVTLGTSVGWSDVYPPSYPQNWIDVTGLRGCFAYREVADPLNGIFESNEKNNAAQVTVRLPYRRGAPGCPGRSRAPSSYQGAPYPY